MIGFRVHTRTRAVAAASASRFLEVPVSNVSDCMSRMVAAGARLRPMHDGTPMAGAAVTVKTRPGDNLMVHKAMMLAEPGDVIVVDAGGDLTNALIGELMVTTAKAKGLAGFVINGAVRDAKALRGDPFPVFAAGVTHRGPYKDGPGEINVPVAIDGMVVNPGDLVIGDEDGILCVPFDAVDAVLAAAQAKAQQERGFLESIREGRAQTAWVDESLKRLGCSFEN